MSNLDERTRELEKLLVDREYQLDAYKIELDESRLSITKWIQRALAAEERMRQAEKLACEPVVLRARVQELLESNTALVEQRRITDRKVMVREFHSAIMRLEIRERPFVPDDETVRYRARLIAEEFFEVLIAMFRVASITLDSDAFDLRSFEMARGLVARIVDLAPVQVQLPELMKETVDLEYVIEGARIAFGVDSTPIWQLVHASNLAKCGGSLRADGKWLKPKDWLPPDIAGELERQKKGPTP